MPLLLGFLFAMTLAWVPLEPAVAHAVLVRSEPADGARLDVAPAAIELEFNEPVTVVRARVVGPDGSERASVADHVARNGTIRLELGAGIDVGAFLVPYRVISADGHVVAGTIVFGVGAGQPPPAPNRGAAGESRVWQTLEVLVAALRNLGLVFGFGTALFATWFGTTAYPAWCARAGWGLLLLAVGSSLALIGIVGGHAQGGDVGQMLSWGAWTTGAATTKATAAGWIGVGATLAGLGLFRGASGSARALVTSGAAMAAIGVASTGHAAAGEGGVTIQAGAVAHALASALWIGAILPLAGVAARAPQGVLSAVLRRFARVAPIAAFVVVASGAALGLSRIHACPELTNSPYGLLLLAKVTVVLSILAIGANNWLRLGPALLSGSTVAHGLLNAGLRVDLGLAAAAILLASLLAHTPPPGSAHHAHASHGAGASVAQAIAEPGGRTARLAIEPGLAGRNALLVEFVDARGLPVVPIEVAVEFALPELGIEPIRRGLFRAGSTTFGLESDDLVHRGRWSVTIDAVVSDFEKAVFETTVTVR